MLTPSWSSPPKRGAVLRPPHRAGLVLTGIARRRPTLGRESQPAAGHEAGRPVGGLASGVLVGAALAVLEVTGQRSRSRWLLERRAP